MTDKTVATMLLHECLCKYKAAEEHFIEVESKRSASWEAWHDKTLEAEYDTAMKIWDDLEDEAFALANIITGNAFTKKQFNRLLSFRIDTLISLTA